MSQLLEGLNAKQIEAVTHADGPLLVVAGAGSGKTRALTYRIAYLIEEKKVNPWNILAVTFTNKAATEMKNRITELLTSQVDQAFIDTFGPLLDIAEVRNVNTAIPTIGTFHSICVRILRKHIHLLEYENTFAIYDMADQQILVKRIMEEMYLDPKRINPKAILSHISNAKNQLMTPEAYGQYVNSDFMEKVAAIYPKYQAALRRNNALDFDDIIMKTTQLFEQFPDVKEQYQDKFKYISVDEYQDTNKAQYVLISQLAEKHKNICVIGDADQSIYGWRGATIQNILDFEKDYEGVKTVFLEQNYRSTQVILDAANMIIAKNKTRQDKKLWTDREGGEKIVQWVADSGRHEAELVAREIKSLLDNSEYPNYKDFVILYRTNAQSRIMEEMFLRYGIPYKIVGGIRFYERKEIKDLLAYLRVIQNPHDEISLLRIINTPSRKIGAKTISSVVGFARQNNLSLFNALLLAKEIPDFSAAKVQTLEKFVKLIKDLQSLNKEFPASGMIKHVVEMTGYKKMLNDGSVEGEARLENIGELVSVAHKYDKLDAGMSLNIFLEEVSLIADVDNLDESDNAVTLMTVHSAKGLEFNNVFITGLEEGIFPHNRSLLDPNELEEERRLMYVAMTRAMDRLYLLHARSRMLYGEAKALAPSQFLSEIDDELVKSNFANSGVRRAVSLSDIGRRPVPIELDEGVMPDLGTGDKVNHPNFGRGIVVGLTGGVVTVAFEDPKVGIKKLALSVAPLKKI